MPRVSTSTQGSPIASESKGSRRGPFFVTTHWSVVLSAQESDSPHSFQALESLCRAYWYPLYAFVRRQGRGPHDAQDLTQAFFARLLEKNYLKSAAQDKGKFRTFLLTALKRFLADEWDRQHAQKRGGFASVLSIDHELAESRFAAEPGHELQPDVLFDRQWAVALIDGVMAQLQEEYLDNGPGQIVRKPASLPGPGRIGPALLRNRRRTQPDRGRCQDGHLSDAGAVSRNPPRPNRQYGVVARPRLRRKSGICFPLLGPDVTFRRFFLRWGWNEL